MMGRTNKMDRRQFFTLSTGLGAGVLTFGGHQRAAASMKAEGRDAEHLRFWLDSVIRNSCLYSGDSGEILEACGCDCAEHYGFGKTAERLRNCLPTDPTIDQTLELMNLHNIGGGNLIRKGKVIRCTYDECHCPLRRVGWVTAEAFCNCTKGWTRAVFEKFLNRPVSVDLVHTIAAGDAYCEIEINLLD
jgi:predicted hydrocarbon binding protein